MFDREDVNEKVLSMDKDYILNNVMLTMENIDGYLPKSSYVPTDNRFTKDMKGIAVTAYVPILEDDDGRAQAVVTYDLLDHFKIGVKELFDNAYNNLNKEPARIRSLTDVITSMTLEGIVGDGEANCIKPEELRGDIGDLYYVTNKPAYKGAISIFSNDTHKRIADAMGEYFVIPSSIHELLIVSCDSIEPDFIADMVKSVNASGIVADKDILCDEVFKFDSKSGSIVTVELSDGRDRGQEADIER